MTLTSAACPLTDVIEDQTAQALEGLVDGSPDQLGVDAAVGPRQDHRRRPRAAARARLQPLSHRVIEVAPERLERWLAGFAERHGPVDAAEEETPGGIVVSATAADGSTVGGNAVRLRPARDRPDPPRRVCRGARHAGVRSPRTRSAPAASSRGRPPVAGPSSVSPGAGSTRPTSSWAPSSDMPVGSCSGTTSPRGPPPPSGPSGIPSALLLGGDRTLAGEVLAAPALRALAGLPTRELYDLPDPRRAVLEDALRRARAVRIDLIET